MTNTSPKRIETKESDQSNWIKRIERMESMFGGMRATKAEHKMKHTRAVASDCHFCLFYKRFESEVNLVWSESRLKYLNGKNINCVIVVVNNSEFRPLISAYSK